LQYFSLASLPKFFSSPFPTDISNSQSRHGASDVYAFNTFKTFRMIGCVCF
jgi:hypothetical protein